MHHFRVFWCRLKQITVPSHQGCQGHDKFFADRIDRRVGDLCEELLEVGVKQPGLQRKHGQRRVVPHRSKCFLAVLDHRLQNQVEFFTRVSERHLLLGQSQKIQLFQQVRGSIYRQFVAAEANAY